MNGSSQRRRGHRNHHAGAAAEAIVAEHYLRSGFSLRDQRWRCAAGEIDLVAQTDLGVVFVEVKSARSHSSAAERVTPQKIERLYAAGAEYLAHMPLGQGTEARFDVALVDGLGQVEVLENAIMM